MTQFGQSTQSRTRSDDAHAMLQGLRRRAAVHLNFTHGCSSSVMHGLRTFSAKASGEPSRTTPLPPDVYHTSFHPSTDFPAYTEKYSDLETGARLDGTVVRLAGRVVARRKASSKLVFYDVNDGRGNIVQVLAEQKYYARHLNSDEESKEAFKSTAGLIRRGDVIGANLGSCPPHSTERQQVWLGFLENPERES